MLKIFLTIYIILFSGYVSASEFSESLSDCYLRYSNQRNDEGDGKIYLKFKKRAFKTSTYNLLPYNPILLGIDVNNGLGEAMSCYNRLMVFREDTELLQKEFNMIAHLQCNFDCWLGEDLKSQNSINHSLECKKTFLYNLTKLEDKLQFHSTDMNIENQLLEDKNDNSKACDSIYFDTNKSIPSIDAKKIIEKVIYNTDKFKIYGILITGYIDWKSEPHYGKFLTKKRMMFVKDLLEQNGISNLKIKGLIVDSKVEKDDSISNVANKRIRICVIDALINRNVGEYFAEKFDYNSNDEIVNGDIESLNKTKNKHKKDH